MIHASPPCQAYSVANNIHGRTDHPDLIAATREALIQTERPYIIENVPRAPLLSPDEDKQQILSDMQNLPCTGKCTTFDGCVGPNSQSLLSNTGVLGAARGGQLWCEVEANRHKIFFRS